MGRGKMRPIWCRHRTRWVVNRRDRARLGPQVSSRTSRAAATSCARACRWCGQRRRGDRGRWRRELGGRPRRQGQRRRQGRQSAQEEASADSKGKQQRCGAKARRLRRRFRRKVSERHLRSKFSSGGLGCQHTLGNTVGVFERVLLRCNAGGGPTPLGRCLRHLRSRRRTCSNPSNRGAVSPIDRAVPVHLLPMDLPPRPRFRGGTGSVERFVMWLGG